MASVVDRLLAQLPGLQGQHAPTPQSVPGRSTVRPAYSASTVASPVREPTITPRAWVGVWGRVLLGLALGVMMAGWPYMRSCGFPLLGYLGAVITVVLTGLWAAAAAWRHRIGLAHVVALVVVLYGLTLTAAELLPRAGYAVDHASWWCADSGADSMGPPVVS
jgi:hypothetical protein